MAGAASRAVFPAAVRTGSALVTDLAASMDGGATSRKGRQEKVSGWLARYDFASPVRDHLWKEGVALVGRDTVVAVDSGDISKEFGGAGMEGMEMGYDASRGVVAMGHSPLCAAVVARRRAAPLRLALLKGRRGLPDAETALFDAVVGAAGDNGIPVHDRGFDSVLVVSSTFNGTTLCLYALNFVATDASARELREAADLAANAYFCRWSVEVLFQDVKQCFSIEDARVRTFRRLENLLAFCTLAYSYFAHVLPRCGEETRRLLKTMRGSLGEIVESFHPFVANVRELLRMERTRFISGRPKKRKPPDMTAFLPGLPA